MPRKTTKAARDLFLAGESLESIAQILNVEVEMVEVWREEGCWDPALDLTTAGSRVSAGTKDAEELDELHRFIADAFGRVIAWLTKAQGEGDLAGAGDLRAWSKLSRSTSKALVLKQKIEADIRRAKTLRNPPHVGGPPCAIARLRRTVDVSRQDGGRRVLRPSIYESDDNAIIARGLAIGLTNFAKALSDEKPRKAVALVMLGTLVSETLTSLWRLRTVMKAVELGRQIEEAGDAHAA